MYKECPQKFKFRYIDKIPESPKSFFSFGKSIHGTLEYFYSAGQPRTLEDILNHYHTSWISEGYKTKEQEASSLQKGEQILCDFYQKHISTFRVPLYMEYRFNLKVNGVPIIGFIDRIDRLGSGKVVITDFKTGGAFSQERVVADPQLTMYQMACEELLTYPVDSLQLYHVNSLTAFRTPPHSEELVKQLRQSIVDTAESISLKQFDPKPDSTKCARCDYQSVCPAWKGQYIGLK